MVDVINSLGGSALQSLDQKGALMGSLSTEHSTLLVTISGHRPSLEMLIGKLGDS